MSHQIRLASAAVLGDPNTVDNDLLRRDPFIGWTQMIPTITSSDLATFADSMSPAFSGSTGTHAERGSRTPVGSAGEAG